MSDRIETLIAPIRDSPFLPEIADRLSRELAEETLRRAKLYEEITPEQKVEFIDGEVILHSPARNVHLDATLNISQLLSYFARMHRLGEVKVEKCLCVFPRNDYEPDIVFFGKAKCAAFAADTVKFPIPDFVVEVLSESTEARDRGVKFEDYAAHGVGEYWIVDAERETVEQYLMRDGAYVLEMKGSTGEIHSQVISGFATPVRAFFNAEENLSALQKLLNE